MIMTEITVPTTLIFPFLLNIIFRVAIGIPRNSATTTVTNIASPFSILCENIDVKAINPMILI